MQKNNIFHLLLLCSLILVSCQSKQTSEGPYFGNGFRNGWADQHSIVIWTRLTKNPELNADGQKFLDIDQSIYREIEKDVSDEFFHKGQIPEGFTLDQMEGACPGLSGEVKLCYYPVENPDKRIELDWVRVDTSMNYTKQWKLDKLDAGAKYKVEIFTRHNARSRVSDTITGFFLLPMPAETIVNTDFCIVTCHDYIRRDDSIYGHKIYTEMLDLKPDFYVHTGDVEYYDKAQPYAFTEDLMRFKWDRLFALQNQRKFYTQITSYFMKDDHDVLCDDVYPGMTYGNVTFERGLEIFDEEQFPSNKKPYKTIRWGKDLQIWIVEGRNYRSNNLMPDGEGKTIWGKEQKEWFFRTITESDATFKVLISPTPILGPDRLNKSDNHANADFKTEGDEIRTFINQFDNVFICNGDRHWQYVSHIENTNLWEFSCGAGSDIHAGGWEADDRRPEHQFLRVEGGFLRGSVSRENNVPVLKFQHYDTDGNIRNEHSFERNGT